MSSPIPNPVSTRHTQYLIMYVYASVPLSVSTQCHAILSKPVPLPYYVYTCSPSCLHTVYIYYLILHVYTSVPLSVSTQCHVILSIPVPRPYYVYTCSPFCLQTQKLKSQQGENTELKRSTFKAWSRSVYSHTRCAYCQGFLPRLFPSFRSIHLHISQNLSRFSPVLAVANTGSCVGPQNKIGHPAGCRFPC